jgi:hypothetical protein
VEDSKEPALLSSKGAFCGEKVAKFAAMESEKHRMSPVLDK